MPSTLDEVTQLLEVDQGACLWFRCQLYHFKAFVTLMGVYDFEPQFPHKYTGRTSPVCVCCENKATERKPSIVPASGGHSVTVYSVLFRDNQRVYEKASYKY